MVRHGETYSNVNSRKMDTVGFEPTTSRKCVSAKRARYPCAKSPCHCCRMGHIILRLFPGHRAHVSTVYHDASESFYKVEPFLSLASTWIPPDSVKLGDTALSVL